MEKKSQPHDNQEDYVKAGELLAYFEKLDKKRMKDWISASNNVVKSVPSLAFIITARLQQLGEIDAMLLYEENKNRDNESLPTFAMQLCCQADMCLLSMYEIIRILNNKINPNKGGKNTDIERINNKKMQDLYESFRTIRVPVAKHESPKKNKSDHGEINMIWPAYTPQKGIGWVVNSDTGNAIWRSELSDQALEVLSGKLT